ncbi:MAG: DUF262 domain-containing protein [bacterium]
MSSVTTFDSTKESLLDILRSIQKGKTQLPDFQRGWIWDDEHIRSLLVSISLSYPIGAVMMLQSGNPDIRLKPRLVEGVTIASPPEPERLILDGQQRLTSLFQSLLFGQAVTTKDVRGKQIKCWYYVDIEKALSPNGDRDEAIRALPEDRIIRNFRGEVINDYSLPEKEYESGLFPFAQIFDCSDWRREYNKFWGHDSEKSKQFDIFEVEIIDRFKQYQVPLIILRKETPKEAVCQVFEKVNTGGVSLTVFELLTATYASDNFLLREDWDKHEKRLKKHNVLENIQSDDFLQSITLLATRARRNQSIDTGTLPENAPGISCKRKDILRLSLTDYQYWVDVVAEGFERAARFLQAQNIFSARDLPYRTQVIPLASILAVLDDWENIGVKTKIARWYWCGVLGELYGGAIETRFAKDVPEMLDWIDNKRTEPSTILDANFVPTRLLTLRTRNSAAYKGIYILLMRDGCQDFRTGDSISLQLYFDDRIDIHHIFPQDWCKQNGIDAQHCDSIVNKTPLSAKTNRIISSNAPSDYLRRIQRHTGIDANKLEEILKSHLIQPETMYSDNFGDFFKARESALLGRIEQAMGKSIPREVSVSDDNTTEDFEDEDIKDEQMG